MSLEIGQNISAHDISGEILTEVLDAFPKAYIRIASYTISCRLIDPDEAELLEVPRSTTLLLRHAVYYNQKGSATSVGPMIFPSDRVHVSFDFIRHTENMKTPLTL